MRWQKVFSQNGASVFHLAEGDKGVLKLTFHPEMGTVRIDYRQQQRLFFLEKEETLLRQKLVMKNEYGLRVGDLETRNGQQSTLRIEQERYRCLFQVSPLPELLIYTSSPKKPIMVCSLHGIEGQESVAARNSTELFQDEYACLQVMLGWYLFQTASTQQPVFELVS